MTIVVINRFKSLKAVTGILSVNSTDSHISSTEFNYGTAVDLTYQMNSSHITGMVTFYSNSDILGTSLVEGGSCSRLINKLFPIGTYILTATYPGDAEYSTPITNSNNLSITINGVVPNPPTDLLVFQFGPNGATVYWTAPNFDGGSEIISHTIYSVPAAVSHTVMGPDSGFYTFTSGLLSNTNYYFIVYATNKYGNSIAASTGLIATATFTISANTLSINEGDTVTFTINTTYFGTGTLYWVNLGTVTAARFSDGLNSGSVAIINNVGSFTRTVRNNFFTDNITSIIMQIHTDSITGTVVATSSTVNVNDTSKTPPVYPPPPPPPITYDVNVTIIAAGGGGSAGDNNGHAGSGGSAGSVIVQRMTIVQGLKYPYYVGTGGPGGTTAAGGGGAGGGTKFGGYLANGGAGGLLILANGLTPVPSGTNGSGYGGGGNGGSAGKFGSGYTAGYVGKNGLIRIVTRAGVTLATLTGSGTWSI